MSRPTHLGTAGQATWDAVTGRVGYDDRDADILATLCDIADLEAQAREAVKLKMDDDALHRSYARIVDKKLKLLDALGLTPKSRDKLGIATQDQATKELDDFLKD